MQLKGTMGDTCHLGGSRRGIFCRAVSTKQGQLYAFYITDPGHVPRDCALPAFVDSIKTEMMRERRFAEDSDSRQELLAGLGRSRNDKGTSRDENSTTSHQFCTMYYTKGPWDGSGKAMKQCIASHDARNRYESIGFSAAFSGPVKDDMM
jgi:hypothetical protein